VLGFARKDASEPHTGDRVGHDMRRRTVLADRGDGRYSGDSLLVRSAWDRRRADGQGQAVSVARIDFNRVCPRVLDSRNCATTTVLEAAFSVSVAR